jgi:hypothetical protein
MCAQVPLYSALNRDSIANLSTAALAAMKHRRSVNSSTLILKVQTCLESLTVAFPMATEEMEFSILREVICRPEGSPCLPERLADDCPLELRSNKSDIAVGSDIHLFDFVGGVDGVQGMLNGAG